MAKYTVDDIKEYRKKMDKDLEKEKARLTAEIERIEGEIARAEGKLNNQNFVAKAPQKLVDAEKEKVAKYQNMKAKCQEQLESL